MLQAVVKIRKFWANRLFVFTQDELSTYFIFTWYFFDLKKYISRLYAKGPKYKIYNEHEFECFIII